MALTTVNQEKLATIKSEGKIGGSAAGTALDEVCRQGAKSDQSVEILQGVMEALGKQTSIPVLWAIDEVQALFTTSDVRTPDYSVLESYHLSTPRLALDYLTGTKAFVRLPLLSYLPIPLPSCSVFQLTLTHPYRQKEWFSRHYHTRPPLSLSPLPSATL